MSVCSTVDGPGRGARRADRGRLQHQELRPPGYESLTAAGSPFQAALTVALTIYVALIGYRLLFGNGARLSDGPASR